MQKIISEVFKLLKNTDNLIEFEEQMKIMMYETFSKILSDVFAQLDQELVDQKKRDGWKAIHKDTKTFTFSFGSVNYKRTLMKTLEGRSVYPLDELLGVRKYQRYSSLVELKVAELASKGTYRETASMLKEWTAVAISHTAVGDIVKRVGGAQAKADEEMVAGLEEADGLPEGKRVAFLMAEADGVFVRGTKRKQGIEVRHAITYEGWEKNGKRVSLLHPQVILTTRPSEWFWSEVQAVTAHRYSLENTQVVTNSDGGVGYTAEKFKEAFSQSSHEVLNQLDTYHISQALNRVFGVKNEWKTKVKKAINKHNLDEFKLNIDTYESTLEDENTIEKVKGFQRYILNNWDRIFDWRTQVEQPPKGARNLGAMESNQRRVSFRMKKRGMHWSEAGAEAMVKIKQGMQNQSLREAYIKNQHRSARNQRVMKRIVRIAQILQEKVRPSIGVKQGKISLHSAHSSAIGQLVKGMR
jgi:hypothetical protein